jgi:hypothetical protein
MKVEFPILRKRSGAFTLTDLLFSSTFLCTGIVAILWSHLTGLKLHSLVDTQLAAAAHERKLWNYLETDLQSAQRIQVGTWSQNKFTAISPGNPQRGTALEIFPSASNTNQYIRYYLESASLKRFSSTNNAMTILSTYIQSADPFQAENSRGIILTNEENLCVVAINISYNQFQESGASINGSNHFRSYNLSTKVAHRRAY